MKNEIKIDAFKVTQQIGDFFIAKITAEKLVGISYSDVRQLSEEREVETYLGIQRPLNKKRAREIKEYVKNIDATFPTSIILSISQELVHWDDNILTIEFGDDSPAKVLDGQHRIAGFMDLDTGLPVEELCNFDRGGKVLPFELLITVFVGLDMAEEANIFATVNLKQTKVSKSLVYDLEAYSSSRSPQKTAHEIVMALDRHNKSPFYGRVKRLGTKQGDYETLTQATLVEEIVSLISKKPMVDRDILLRREKDSFTSFRTGLAVTNFSDGLIFRNLFIQDEDDIIFKFVSSFYMAVDERWATAWDKNNKKSVLNKTVGIQALFRVLKNYCMEQFLKDGYKEINKSEFIQYLNSIELDDDYFESLDAKSATTSKIVNAIWGKI